MRPVVVGGLDAAYVVWLVRGSFCLVRRGEGGRRCCGLRRLRVVGELRVGKRSRGRRGRMGRQREACWGLRWGFCLGLAGSCLYICEGRASGRLKMVAGELLRVC